MGFVRDLTGKTAATAARQAGDIQQEQALASAADVGEAGGVAQQFLQPFQQVGQRGIDLAGFLGDPSQQFDFLQSNPLFQSALESANLRTERGAAARGRSTAGDTLEELTANTFQTARPFLQDQRSDILNLLNLGRGVASEQAGITRGTAADVAGLETGGAAAQAGGRVGAATARGQGASNILSGAITAGSFFSDVRLKKNIKLIGNENGHKTYSWDWNSLAKTAFNLIGSSNGVIAQEVSEINPSAISFEKGFMKVNYSMIGVEHG